MNDEHMPGEAPGHPAGEAPAVQMNEGKEAQETMLPKTENHESGNTPAAELVGTWIDLCWARTNMDAAAASLGTTHMSLNRWERGETAPTAEQIERIEREIKAALALPAEEFDELIAKRAGVAVDELRANRGEVAA